MMKVAVVVLAAGSGTRFGHSTNKVWLPLDEKKIISHSLANAAASFADSRVILVIDPSDSKLAEETLREELPDLKIEFVEGGLTRHDSEFNALRYLAESIQGGEIDVVLIHDGARPLASSELFHQIALAAQLHGGALPAILVDPLEIDVVQSNSIARVQTPQAFRAKEVLAAYISADRDGFVGTDTAACMEAYSPESESVAVPGEVTNIKITYPYDLMIATKILAQRRSAS